ncbi:MAG: thioredoxin family protein [Desulfobacterales bacterium]
METDFHFDPTEKEAIRAASPRLTAGTVLRLEIVEGRDEAALEPFCHRLIELLPGLRIERRPPTEGDLPALVPRERVRFLGAPRGRELPVFLEILTGESVPPPPPPRPAAPASPAPPAELELFVSSGCTFCPQALRLLLPLVHGSPWVRLQVIDAESHPARFREREVRSVPTLLLDNRFRWVGAVNPEEVLRVASGRDPREISAASLERLLKEGEARRLALWMVEHRSVFPALRELLCREEWPVRLGAMVTVEEIQARDPDLAAAAIAPLAEQLASLPERVQGDLLYLLGEIASPRFLPPLESFAAAAVTPELAAAAREAAERVRAKKNPGR